VGDLVQREPEAEVALAESMLALDLDDVRPHEVHEVAIVAGQEQVVLAEDLSGQIPEDRSELERQDPAAQRSRTMPVPALEELPGDGLQDLLETAEVLVDPLAAGHHPGTRAGPAVQ
jgi:hypothetical protein